MSKASKKILKFFIAICLSVTAFIFIPHYAQISELDDVFVAGLTVIPAFFISVVLCLMLIKDKCLKISFTLTSVNTVIAFFTIYLTRHAAWEFLSFNNSIYDGKVEYTSFHLFSIGIIPVILVLSTWIYLIIKTSEKKKRSRQ